MQQQTCNHKTCQKIRQLRNSSNVGGVGIVFVNNYNSFGNYAILLGEERGGQYQGQYNLCAGKVDPCDHGCYIKAAKRESKEEFKINIDDKQVFDSVFKNNKGKVRFIMHHGTPIFVGVLKGVSRKQINPIISACNNNSSLPHSQREMKRVDYFWLSNSKQIEGHSHQISPFASSVMSKVDVNKL